MEVINFFEDQTAWERNELFFPLRRFFAPFENNPYDGKPHSEIKDAFLKAIHADRRPVFNKDTIEELESSLKTEALRFRSDFGKLLSDSFKVLLFPMSSNWEFVMKHLDGTWGVTFPSCIVLAAHPEGKLNRLCRILHHEANHSIRLKYIDDDHSFLDRIILEGMAEVYVDEKFPGEASSKYTQAIDDLTFETWLPKLREFWSSEEIRFDQYKDYVYGSEEKKIPRWLGYSTGYRLVKSFRAQNPNIRWSEFIQIPSQDLIK